MSGQHQHFDRDEQDDFIPSLTIPTGIVRSILGAGLDMWRVKVTNRDTGQVWHDTYRAASADDAETFAYHAATHDADGSYDVCATLEQGVRKLWDVVPNELPDALEALQLRAPRLIGRVVAVDAEAAMLEAVKTFDLPNGDDFYVCQV